jgi:hypothetical protein
VTGEAFLLRTGAYWLDTMERWKVTMPGGKMMGGDDILLVALN